MRETTQEINKATNDPETQARIQISWRLQDLLIIPDVVSTLFELPSTIAGRVS